MVFDNPGKPLACYRANASARLLYGKQEGNLVKRRPELAKSELRTRLRIGGDSGRIVIRRSRDNPGPQHPQKPHKPITTRPLRPSRCRSLLRRHTQPAPRSSNYPKPISNDSNYKVRCHSSHACTFSRAELNSNHDNQPPTPDKLKSIQSRAELKFLLSNCQKGVIL